MVLSGVMVLLKELGEVANKSQWLLLPELLSFELTHYPPRIYYYALKNSMIDGVL